MLSKSLCYFGTTVYIEIEYTYTYSNVEGNKNHITLLVISSFPIFACSNHSVTLLFLLYKFKSRYFFEITREWIHGNTSFICCVYRNH